MELLTILSGIINIIKNHKNKIILLLSIELTIIGIVLMILNTGIQSDDILGISISLIILTIAAAESAIGLSIILKNML